MKILGKAADLGYMEPHAAKLGISDLLQKLLAEITVSAR